MSFEYEFEYPITDGGKKISDVEARVEILVDCDPYATGRAYEESAEWYIGKIEFRELDIFGRDRWVEARRFYDDAERHLNKHHYHVLEDKFARYLSEQVPAA